jgi:hypothetical protein
MRDEGVEMTDPSPFEMRGAEGVERTTEGWDSAWCMASPAGRMNEQ